MIDIHKCLDFIRDNAKAMAQARANRVYLEEYRKSLKAMLMAKSIEKTQNGKECDAYSHQSYLEHLDAIRQAVEVEEKLRWEMVAAQAKIEVFRTLEASARFEMKSSSI
jgi:hypothetical protein